MNKKTNTKRYRYIMKIPNDKKGIELLNNIKYYINTDRYKVRLKGSKLNDDRIRKFNPNILPHDLKREKQYRNNSGSMLLGYCDYIRIYLDDKCE